MRRFRPGPVETVGYWQYEMQRYKEALYAEKIEQAAKRAGEASEAKQDFSLT